METFRGNMADVTEWLASQPNATSTQPCSSQPERTNQQSQSPAQQRSSQSVQNTSQQQNSQSVQKQDQQQYGSKSQTSSRQPQQQQNAATPSKAGNAMVDLLGLDAPVPQANDSFATSFQPSSAPVAQTGRNSLLDDLSSISPTTAGKLSSRPMFQAMHSFIVFIESHFQN
jgi:hypothetical protein